MHHFITCNFKIKIKTLKILLMIYLKRNSRVIKKWMIKKNWFKMFINPNLKDQKHFYHIPSEEGKKSKLLK